MRGITTPFVESFDAATPLSVPNSQRSGSPEAPATVDTVSSGNLNHFLKPAELERALQDSYILTQPLVEEFRGNVDHSSEDTNVRMHNANHERAVAAISRIVDLENGNSKDRTRANVQRCIATFGRHSTDGLLRPRAPSQIVPGPGANPLAVKTPRAGPDTGSSEVQIAILTAKIRVLANHLEAKGGNKDKMNKRNMRVLVHRRQKHLAYLRKKERGSERWQNLIETLGLTEGTWKGEITL